MKSRAEVYQREIDALLKEAIKHETLSWKKAFSYAKFVSLFGLFLFEVHAAAIATFIIILGTGIFIPVGTADTSTRLSLVVVAMLIGTSLSIFVFYLLLPFHIRYKINLWLITALHSLACAVIFSLLEPEIIRNFQVYSLPVFHTVPLFRDILIPVLLLFALFDIFIIWQVQSRICVRDYQEKHTSDHIETLLPAEKRGKVWLMTAADHYIEVFTDQGSHMHRITMKAAVDRVEKNEGLRVHRSHWVAYEAMLSLEKNGERFFLTLRNGQKVPVSPKALPVVQCHLDVDCRQAAE